MENRFELLGRGDQQWGRPSQQAKGTDEPKESETMVAMQVRDEDGFISTTWAEAL